MNRPGSFSAVSTWVEVKGCDRLLDSYDLPSLAGSC